METARLVSAPSASTASVASARRQKVTSSALTPGAQRISTGLVEKSRTASSACEMPAADSERCGGLAVIFPAQVLEREGRTVLAEEARALARLHHARPA